MVKTYFRYLTEEDRVRCQINVEKGNVESFVIQYEILIGNQWSPVTRFDTFHEGVHRDLIEPGGKVMKKWFLHLGFDEGLTFAYNDIEKNWNRYRQRYLSKLEKKL